MTQKGAKINFLWIIYILELFLYLKFHFLNKFLIISLFGLRAQKQENAGAYAQEILDSGYSRSGLRVYTEKGWGLFWKKHTAKGYREIRAVRSSIDGPD
jgi:hypothetical protein